MKKVIIGGVLSCLALNSTAQTCSPDVQIIHPDSQYEIITNSTEVKDKVTGLIWQRCSIGQSWNGNTCIGTAKKHSWMHALYQAKSLGNRYRLPNIKEFQSLVETACNNPAINNTIFPNTQHESYVRYWSSSPFAYNSEDAWMMWLSMGDFRNSNKGTAAYVRAVR